jgi:uncharacterized protein YuzE
VSRWRWRRLSRARNGLEAFARESEFHQCVLSVDAMGSPPDRAKPRVTYDAQANAAYVYLVDAIRPGEAVRQQVIGNVILDFDIDGKLLGIEVLDARGVLRETTLAMAEPKTK